MRNRKPVWLDRLGRTVLGLVIVGLLIVFLVPNIQAQAIRVSLGVLAVVFAVWLVAWGWGSTNLLPPPFGTVFAWLWRSGGRDNSQ